MSNALAVAFRVAVAGLALVLTGESAFACQTPSRAGGIVIAFPNVVSNLRDGWFLDVAVGHGPRHRVEVDTGSVGLAIAASAIPSDIPRGRPLSIRYSSSGKVLSGYVYRAEVALRAVAGTRTVTIPLFGVNRVTCDRVSHPECIVEPGEADRIGVLGVGFGRHGSGADLAETLGIPERSVNVFLQLEAMRAGRVERSYAIFPDRIELGRPRAEVGGWQRVPLARGNGGDWNPLGGCFAQGPIPGHCVGGTVLVDTGVGTTIFATPEHPSGPVAAGIPFEIAVDGAPDLGLSFTSTAHCEGVVLSCARWSHRAAFPTFLNTSRRAIQALDYRFDDACGVVEFRKTSDRP